jgi:hypothetical protein
MMYFQGSEVVSNAGYHIIIGMCVSLSTRCGYSIILTNTLFFQYPQKCYIYSMYNNVGRTH